MDFNDLYSEYCAKLNSLGLNPTDHLLLANVDKQEIAYFCQWEKIKYYSMSSSKQPPSCMENSLGTPWGFMWYAKKSAMGKKKGWFLKDEDQSV
jgi:hypothetical protein